MIGGLVPPLRPVTPSTAARRPARQGRLLLALDLAVVSLRVAIAVTTSLALFLAAFFGYLIAPFVVLIVFIALYALVDRQRVRSRLELERRRRILDDPVPDPIYGDEQR